MIATIVASALLATLHQVVVTSEDVVKSAAVEVTFAVIVAERELGIGDFRQAAAEIVGHLPFAWVHWRSSMVVVVARLHAECSPGVVAGDVVALVADAVPTVN